MTRARVGVVLLAALVAGPAARAAAQKTVGVEVAILPFTPAGKVDPAAARVADRCSARLLERLAAAGVRAVRIPEGSLERLRRDRLARFAVETILEHDRGKFSAELRLLEVASGDELRSYLYGWGEEAGVEGLAVAAAPRIAAVVREPGR